MADSDIEFRLQHLPQKPGVYRMIGGAGEVLYVGKARNLRNRVTSYFRASGLTNKTMALVAKIADIEITITASETEALLLEQSLIKNERPPYNILLRDDKSYPFIHLTEHAEFPRLAFHRGTRRKGGRYFGPFPSAHAVRESLNILQKLFRLRNCDDAVFRNRSRACLQHQIGRCSGPCVGLVSAQDYREDVDLAMLFLEGKSQTVLDSYKARMQAAADQLEFEQAARYRDQIDRLRRVQEQQYVHAEEGDVDIFAVAQSGTRACIQGIFVRGGRVLGNRAWFPRDELEQTPGEVLGAMLAQYYLAGQTRDLPRDVIVSEPWAEQDLLADALAASAGRRVAIAHSVRGQRARWLALAQENAAHGLASYLADQRSVYARFVALQDALGLSDLPARMECFDISHTMGEATVASCVVFDGNGPRKSDYRRFNIEGITPGDDYAAMEQALRRRYTRVKAGEVEVPDLIVIDGGPGQLARAIDLLSELGLDGPTVLGIAKGPTRKPGLERFFLDGAEVTLPSQGDAMLLLQQIRDEAHRFAITGHRQRRQKTRQGSTLDDIPGVGPKRRRELITHFGGLRALRGASAEEIAKVPGISRKLAQEIYGILHAE